jgi:hypothetical protein
MSELPTGSPTGPGQAGQVPLRPPKKGHSVGACCYIKTGSTAPFWVRVNRNGCATKSNSSRAIAPVPRAKLPGDNVGTTVPSTES